MLKEISKNKSKNSPASTALRSPQPLTQSLSDVSGVKLMSGGWVGETETKELNFYDIGLETGTDKVQGQKNLHLCLKEGKMCNEPKHVREEASLLVTFISHPVPAKTRKLLTQRCRAISVS